MRPDLLHAVLARLGAGPRLGAVAHPPEPHRPSAVRVLHAPDAQRRPAPRPPLRALPRCRRLRPLPAPARQPGLAPDRQRRLPELRHGRRRQGRPHSGRGRGPLLRRDRRDAEGDGHRGRRVLRHQRRARAIPRASRTTSRVWSTPGTSAPRRRPPCSTPRPTSTSTRSTSAAPAPRASATPAATSARSAASPTWSRTSSTRPPASAARRPSRARPSATRCRCTSSPTAVAAHHRRRPGPGPAARAGPAGLRPRAAGPAGLPSLRLGGAARRGPAWTAR